MVSVNQAAAVLEAVQSGRLIVDVDAGTVTRLNGKRAETVTRQGYGQVSFGSVRAMAHRVIWIAAHGLIPDGMVINHKNGKRWDNRIANLELMTPGDNTRHGARLMQNTRRHEINGSIMVRARRVARW